MYRCARGAGGRGIAYTAIRSRREATGGTSRAVRGARCGTAQIAPSVLVCTHNGGIEQKKRLGALGVSLFAQRRGRLIESELLGA